MLRPRSLGSNRRLAGGLFVVVFLLLVGIGWQLARSEADGRAALRDRFADRAPVATSVVNSILRTAFNQQGQTLGPRLGGARVPGATLDALVRQNKGISATVLDARGRVVGASRRATARPGLARFERVALKSGYGLAPVLAGHCPCVVVLTPKNRDWQRQ